MTRMSLRRRAFTRVRRAARGQDAGLTVVELVVSMFVLTFVLAGAASFAIGMQRTVARTQLIARTQTELRGVADILARQLPAASAISDPGRTGGSWYVEYRIDATATGVPICYQWKLDGSTRILQERSWDPGTGTPSAWVTYARDVTNDASTQPPFVVVVPPDASVVARVDTALSVKHAGGPELDSLETFTLRNLALGSTGSTSCNQVARS